MSCSTLRTASALVEGCDAAGWGDGELIEGLRAAGELSRVLDRQVVEWVAVAQRRGVFAERGYRDVIGAVSELLGVDRVAARLRVRVAEHVCGRVGLDGVVLAPLLWATAAGFAAGDLGLRHVDVIAAVLDSDSARRLSAPVWAGAEQQLAEHAPHATPTQLASWGRELIEALDADGAAPDDDPPPPTNELLITRHRDGTGRVKARFDDPTLFAAITTAIDAAAAPRDGEDRRPVGQRQAEALAEISAQVLDHGRLPETGGSRPQLVVHIRLEDLQERARSGVLDTGGICDPAGLRRLACDAAVIPVVLGGAGQPLDVGRATRTIPDGLRRAVLARDRGCAHPGCDRPPSWTEIHHVVPWAQGGTTAIDDLVALCRVHHRQTHTSGWEIRMVAGVPEFRPPAWIDPTRTPRRRACRPASPPRGRPPHHPARPGVSESEVLGSASHGGAIRATTVLTADEFERRVEQACADAARPAVRVMPVDLIGAPTVDPVIAPDGDAGLASGGNGVGEGVGHVRSERAGDWGLAGGANG